MKETKHPTDLETYQPIKCETYDYLEIACLDAYEIEINLISGSTLRGQANTTKIESGVEFLSIITKDEPQKVRLDKISHIRVLSEPRRFDAIDFQ